MNIQAMLAAEFRVRPAPPRPLTFDKHHVFHIDGKPLFPIDGQEKRRGIRSKGADGDFAVRSK